MIVDLSLPLENESFEGRSPQISYWDHAEGARRMARILGVDAAAVGGGVGNAMELVTASTHSGTHVDAPYHFGPTVGGVNARTIDQLPLEWFFNAAVKLDVSDSAPGTVIQRADLERVLARQDLQIGAARIALLATGASRYWHHPDFTRRHPGLGREAMEWLLDEGIRIVGTDANSIDVPHDRMAEAHKAGGTSFFEAHWLGREREFCIVEKLTNLEALPSGSTFRVALFPIKIARASGAWCRAVAFLDDDSA